MRYFPFNNMNEDEFNREFLRFLNMYQSGLENFMKKNYGTNKNQMKNPFFGIDPIDDDIIKKMFKISEDDMNIEKGNDENGEWEKRSWSSPDGSTSFSSFSKSAFYNPFDGKIRFKEESDDVDTVKLLEKKLNQAILDEKYEDAAKIRDLIKSLKEDEK